MFKIICNRCGSEVAETANIDDFMRFGHKSAGGVLYPKGFDLCFDLWHKVYKERMMLNGRMDKLDKR